MLSKVLESHQRLGWSILVLSRFITLLAKLACPTVPISFRALLERRLHIIKLIAESELAGQAVLSSRVNIP